MIVGCYVMDLYCDNEEVKHPYKDHPDEYTGRNERECKRDARADGWRFTRDGKVYCPLCEKERRSK